MQWKYLFTAATAALCLWGANSRAQNASDPFFLNYTHFPGTDFKEREGRSAVHYLEAGLLTPPVRAGKSTRIVNGFYYRLAAYDFNELHSSWSGLPEHLHNIRYNMIITHRFSPQWSLLAVPRLDLRSDLQDGLSGKDLFPGITALAIRSAARRPQLRWGIGAMYNSDFRRHLVIPAAALFYQTEKMRINIVTPNGQIVFTPSKRLEYGFALNVDAGIYHTGMDTVSHGPVQYIRAFNVLLSPLLSYNICRNLWLNGKAGYALMRRYDLLDADFEDEQAWRQDDLQNGLFITIGISMRLPTAAAKSK
ncbi:DUF6268 family outer membrane beta-barrel protein [Chitinophaga japonensis]|uniref:DUF6268 domain-containing protein n=1 Tax=Chitinophaga japonensis TaxID=104662 RepID=A0A562T523_CHIJA|nr:DUF6268 family outer membrane beta-barrel protein [Chitinophaga japonensis]TWI88156.1 hypothetical protein LX66_2231 [Chitinophaga japonensis]